MKLSQIVRHLQVLATKGRATCAISGVAQDSRAVRQDHLFVAVPGHQFDGYTYVAEAIRRGAVAVISEAPPPPGKNPGVTFIQVPSARIALAVAAAVFHGQPSRKLKLVGVTGTNGKTSVASMTRDLLTRICPPVGLLGTVQYDLGRRVLPARRTTPDSATLQALLAEMVQAGCGAAVMEVSSHALDQSRVHGVAFDVGVFTNLSPDHLDYHGTMEAYFETKARWFEEGGVERQAVINGDDPWGRRLMKQLDASPGLLSYGLSPEAEIRAEQLEATRSGSRFQLVTPWGATPVHLAAVGTFNVYNALASVAAAGTLGLPLEEMAAGLAGLHPVPGRLERIPNDRDLDLFVDYAHTTDALSQALQALRPRCRGRLIVVFGCGGDRDQGKREPMGRVAGELADRVILTSDNPRSEDPLQIIEAIRGGVASGVPCEVYPDRREALGHALSAARPGDTILVAGKGHERYQEVGGTMTPFDDRDVLKALL